MEWVEGGGLSSIMKIIYHSRGGLLIVVHSSTAAVGAPSAAAFSHPSRGVALTTEIMELLSVSD